MAETYNIFNKAHTVTKGFFVRKVDTSQTNLTMAKKLCFGINKTYKQLYIYNAHIGNNVRPASQRSWLLPEKAMRTEGAEMARTLKR